MRTAGLQGFRRGKAFVTTKADPAATCPPDLVTRDFSATRPNQLWVVDFTYVPTWSGMGFTAFVSDVVSRRIVGGRTDSRMPTELPLDALEMALWTRTRGASPLMASCTPATPAASTPRSGTPAGSKTSALGLDRDRRR
jgi:putative transposase